MSKPSSRHRVPFWKIGIVALILGWIAIWISRMMLTPIYPILSAYFDGASLTQLGLISSFYFLGYLLMQIPSGLLVDRLGMKIIVVPGFIVFGLGTLGMALSTSLSTMYIASFFSGLGCGTFFGIAYTVTNVYVPIHRRSLATALVNSGTAIGSGIGLAASSLLVSTGTLAWQNLAVAAGSFALIMALVYARIMPGQNSAESPAALERKLNNLANETARSSFFKPPMVAAYILYFSTLYLYYLISTWLPDYLGSVKGFESSLTGIVSSIVFFAGVPGAILFSKLADRFPARKYHFVITLEALAVCALMSTLAAKTNEEIIAGIALYGFFGKLAVEPIIISWLNGFISPWNTATALGTLNFFGMSASVIAPFITGALADTTGRGDLGFCVAAAVTLLGTIAFATVAAPYKKELH